MITALLGQRINKRKKNEKNTVTGIRSQNTVQPLYKFKNQHKIHSKGLFKQAVLRNAAAGYTRLCEQGLTKWKNGKKGRPASGKKNKLLFAFLIFTFILLLFSSLAFSFAIRDTDDKQIKLQDIAPDDNELSKWIGTAEETVVTKPIPSVHIVQPGDTIYGIARLYNVSLYPLLLHNKIEEPTKLKINQSILIPQIKAAAQNSSVPVKYEKADALPGEIAIKANILAGTAPLQVQFSLDTALAADSLHYIWDFGNTRFAFTREANSTYKDAGEYRVFLMIADAENHTRVSNKLLIRVNPPVKKREEMHTNATSAYYFLTAGQVNEVLDLRALLNRDAAEVVFDMDSTKIEQSAALINQVAADQFLTVNTGYAKIRISNTAASFNGYLFVSPFPSKHAYDPPYNWYKTQFNTGLNGNCGPACAAMAIHWAKGKNVSVEGIRRQIGMPLKSGAIGLNHIFEVLDNYQTSAFYTTINSKEDFFACIDRGNIAIFSFYTGRISKTTGDKTTNLTGRYYPDVTGHYSIVKGYTLDKKYLIVYDPIPADWDENSIRYGDGASMLGRNRYYPAAEVMKALQNIQAVEISR